MILFRPTGLKELELVFNSEMKEWPPRLPEQPIFYPVLNVEYARQIAREWNTKSENRVGFVTEFKVNDEFIKKYKKQIVGSQVHEELWIPAEELTELNRNIIGQIHVVDAYFGTDFTGFVPDNYELKNKNAKEQFITLAGIYDYNKLDFNSEIACNNKSVYLNLLYWEMIDFDIEDLFGRTIKQILEEIVNAWNISFPEIALPRSIVNEK